MRYPILVLTRNNLHLTRKAIQSFRAQDVPVEIVVLDNGSTDGTVPWLNSQRDLQTMIFNPQLGVAAGWNVGLRYIFKEADYCLVCNNDVELHPASYQHLLEDGGGFITLVGVREMPGKLDLPPDPAKKRPHPDFSAFLIRKEVYEKVGPFDQNFKVAFAEDGDFDIRMFKAGIRAACIDLPYLHHGSMTVKNAELREQRLIHKQAEANREYFTKKWGFPMGSEAYYKALDKGGPS